MAARYPCHPGVQWAGWPDDSDIVALVVVDAEGVGTVWYNTRFQLGILLVLVDRWARYALDHGRRFDAIRLDDLARLR